MITSSPTDKMTDAEFMVLKARCEREGTSVSEVRREMFADQVVADIFCEDDLKLTRLKDGIAQKQSQLDQLEAAAREKAESFLCAIARRDTLVATARLLNERRARITDRLEGQPNYIEAIGADKSRSDADFVDSCDFVQKYRAALVALESLLEQSSGNLILAEAEVAAFQK